MIYTGSPAEHMPGLAAVAKERLRENWRCLYLNSPRMIADMRVHLGQAGVAVAQEVEHGALVLSSDQSHLHDGRFDVDRMLSMVTDAVNQALREGYAGLWATGDMGWEFGDEKNFAKLLEYEYALERLFEKQPALAGVCQYHADALPTDVVQWGLCSHRFVYINEALSQANPYYAPAHLLTYRRPVVPGVQVREMLAHPAQPLQTLCSEIAV